MKKRNMKSAVDMLYTPVKGMRGFSDDRERSWTLIRITRTPAVGVLIGPVYGTPGYELEIRNHKPTERIDRLPPEVRGWLRGAYCDLFRRTLGG